MTTDPATTLMTYLSQVENPDLLTKSELKTEIGGRFDRLESRLEAGFEHVNKRIDRVLLAVVGGLFVTIAAYFGTGAFS